MAAKILMVLSTSIVFMLGVVHLVYTFWGPTLTPRDPALQISMSQIAPVITKETTMWRVGLAMLGGIVVLCKVYFFSAPLIGMSISLACYVASIALSRAFILRS